MEPSASFEARYAPLPYPTNHMGLQGSGFGYHIDRRGDLQLCDPPNPGCCRDGPSTGCYNLKILQYWCRRNDARTWTRDPSLEIDLSESKPGAEPGSYSLVPKRLYFVPVLILDKSLPNG